MITRLVAKYYDLLRKEVTVCSRKDYWIFAFITFFINVILLFSFTILENFGFPYIFYLPLFLISIALLICQMVLITKRLHDINLSGYWLLMILILPIFHLLLLMSSVTYNNKYIPKENLMTEEDEKENEQLEAFINVLEEKNFMKERSAYHECKNNKQ